MTDVRTWEDELRSAGKPIRSGASYACAGCERPEHAFALVEDAGGVWTCSSCRAAAALEAAAAAGPDPLTWADIRGQRQVFLEASDWTQLLDVPEATRSRWAAFRQRARDLTEHPDPDAAQAALRALREEAGL